MAFLVSGSSSRPALTTPVRFRRSGARVEADRAACERISCRMGANCRVAATDAGGALVSEAASRHHTSPEEP